MMGPPVRQPAGVTTFTPTADVRERHEYGVTKNRKTTSTGGGRAWSEDEEVYLLQTRLQKMPYKHIAAHLKKTELACRLHYHQLSHGNNRRKRTTSMSSGSSAGQSPIMPARAPSLAHEASSPRNPSPPGSADGHRPTSPAQVQLPGVANNAGGPSPGLPQILPKPMTMTLPPPNLDHTRGYPTPLPDATGALPSATFSSASTGYPTTPPLKLDCSPLPPTQAQGYPSVDMKRLQASYAAHCGSFWTAIASEYGGNVAPAVLEQAWKTGVCCHQHGSAGSATTPISPVSSPDSAERDPYVKSLDKTRISAILGIDADPRSPREREMVRRMEEERTGAVSASP